MVGRVRRIAWFAIAGALAACAGTTAPPLAEYQVVGDEIRQPLTDAPPDAARGREVLAGRDANCLLCHSVPGEEKRSMGNVGPPLEGVANRLTEGQLRLRIVDSMRLNRNTAMPSYYRVTGLNQVAEAYRGKPVLNAQQVEDILAYLATLH